MGAQKPTTLGIERTMLRLAVLGILVVAAFVALFSRLWFLQVLASEQYSTLAKENRVRLVESEPSRGRILDRNGKELVKNRFTTAVTVEREILENPEMRRMILRKLSRFLKVDLAEIKARLRESTLSPYKPVAVANEVPEKKAAYILSNQEDFPGVDVDTLPLRYYPQRRLGAHLFGYVGEIRPEQLKADQFKNAMPPYRPGDIVGQSGLELTYDAELRGKPEIRKVIVNSAQEVIAERLKQKERPGRDLLLALDARIQRITERALEAGVLAARAAGYEAPGGAVVVMDPNNGDIVGMASFPTYNPRLLADGITQKEWDKLGQKTPKDNSDDRLLNRAIQSGVPPGSTFKVVTAGAALATDVASTSTYLPCPGAWEYRGVTFPNWTSADFGTIGFPTSLEISCDTFYYQLGARLEEAFGPEESAGGDNTERFQKYMRLAGFGHETGIDLPNEFDGTVPDKEWCEENRTIGYCPDGWLPGYTVNMSIGQGDLRVTPLQMAVTFGALANGGNVMRPRLGVAVGEPTENGKERVVREFEPEIVSKLPLDAAEIGAIEQGLEAVVASGNGTAASAFAGFPLEEYPIAGKTGTAQIGETDLNYAWFTSYGPTHDPGYVVSVYLERAGHGGESAAPIAREIWEGIFRLDEETSVQLGEDASR